MFVESSTRLLSDIAVTGGRIETTLILWVVNDCAILGGFSTTAMAV
jgi:hypothetical protein